MTGSPRRARTRDDVARVLIVLGTVLAGTGCAGRDPQMPSGDDRSADARLEQQRLAVRDLARSLRDEVAVTWGGSALEATAGWDGCGASQPADDPSGLRYVARVRMAATAPGGSEPGARLGAALEAVATDGGLHDLDRSDPGTVRARDGDLEVSLWSLPPGGTGDLLVSVHGPCVEVPAADREGWSERRRGEDPL